MNPAAERHLVQAQKHVAKGDEFYWKAGQEILAAQKADPTLSHKEIGRWFDKSAEWVRALVQHVTTAEPDTPVDWRRGSHGTKAERDAHLDKFLREAPLEQVERAVSELPRERKQEIRTAI